jgi:hypothetical protein
MKTCKVCNQPIPEGRVKALPHAETCVEHSDSTKFVANVISHGDLEDDFHQEIQIVRDAKTAQALNAYAKMTGNYK